MTQTFTSLYRKSRAELITEIYQLRSKLSQIEKKNVSPELDIKEAAIQIIKKGFPDFSNETLMNRGRMREWVVPRQIFCYLLYRYTNISLQEIGRLLLRDHSTIIHARDTVEDICSYDKKFATLVSGMANEFKMYLSSGEH